MTLQQFEDLFNTYFVKLCAKAYLISGDKEAARDIVQDVFIRFWDRKDELQKVDSIEAYLYKSVVNQALNYINSHKRKMLHQEKILYVTPSSSNDVEDNINESELQQRITYAIEKLSPMCKKVFLLSRYEQMTYKEIASFLAISENTVDNHIKKALAILRKVIDK